MSLAALGLATSLIPAIGKLITSKKQKKKADELRDTERPEYETPKSQKQSLNILKGLSTVGLQNKSTLLDRAKESTSSAARKIQETATNPSGALAALSNVYGQEMDTTQDIELADAEQRINNLKGLISGLGTQADFEDKEFYINEFQPYLQDQYAASQLTGAAMQNKFGAIEDFSKIGNEAVAPLADVKVFGIEDDKFSDLEDLLASGSTFEEAAGALKLNNRERRAAERKIRKNK